MAGYRGETTSCHGARIIFQGVFIPLRYQIYQKLETITNINELIVYNALIAYGCRI